MCVAEWEEQIAGKWAPYHTTRGFAAADSVVTVLSVTSGPHQVGFLFHRVWNCQVG